MKDVFSFTQAIDCVLDRAVELERAANECVTADSESRKKHLMQLAEDEISFACTIAHLACERENEKAAQLLADHGINI